jgi:hypothetical protein
MMAFGASNWRSASLIQDLVSRTDSFTCRVPWDRSHHLSRDECRMFTQFLRENSVCNPASLPTLWLSLFIPIVDIFSGSRD